MPYLYESHLGGFYSVDEPQDSDDLYCEQCGDSDWELGEYETLQDAWDILKDKTSIFGTGGYCLDLTCSFLTGINRDELQDMNEIQMLQLIDSAINGCLWRAKDV